VNERLSAIRAARARRAAASQRVSIGRPIALGVAAAAAVLFLIFRGEPLRFAVGESNAPGVIGAWVAAPPEASTSIGFSDGTRVVVAPGARARVVSVNGHGARVVVERGTVHAEVVPRSGNDWSVIGGPFEIHVTGTKFDASWDPDTEVLRVAMIEGRVAIGSACLEGLRSLSVGESATLSCPRAASTPAPSEPAPSVAAKPEASMAPRPSPAALPATPSSTSAVGIGTADATPGWRELARRGAYRDALARAEAEGFGALSESASMADLMELATTARLAGNAARAVQAYSAVRKRFAGTDSAATAAFHLGQMAFDGAHAYADAHRWFLVYLTERPGGTLAAEALGRTMEAEQRMGDLTSARGTAAKYLSRYPEGAHAPLARSLVAP
jgi:TolA-binding protein